MKDYFGMDSFRRSYVYSDTGSCGPMGVTSTSACIDMNKGTISCFDTIDDKIDELKKIYQQIDIIKNTLPISTGNVKIIDNVLRLHRGNLNFVFKKN